MNKTGPILIIENSADDKEFLKLAFAELNYKNEIMFFADGEEALEFLHSSPVEPFIIISDIDLPKLNGLALKSQIQNNEDLRLKCIPYLFFTSSADQQHVIDAYSKSVQGFFIKPQSLVRVKRLISLIIEYWLECESPNYIR